MVLEFWVMRVLLHPGPMRKPMTTRSIAVDAISARAIMAAVARDELTTLPDGCIAEPVDEYPSEVAAHIARERHVHDDPNGDYRVVLNSSLLAPGANRGA